MAEAREVIEAEKGNHLSLRSLHLRLRVVEVVLLVSLILNLAHWFVASSKEHSLQNQVDSVNQTR